MRADRRAVVLASLSVLALCGLARAAEPKPLVDLSAGDAASKFKPTSGDVTVAAGNGAVNVTFQPGKEGYPGVDLVQDGPLDLSQYGHIEAKVTNTGKAPILVAMRVDGDGPWQDNPWNTEQTYVQPGKTGTITLIFGYSYGHKPAYALKSNAIKAIKLFTGKVKAESSFRLESLVAAGQPGEVPAVDPATIRIKPKDGQALDSKVLATAPTGGTAKVEGDTVTVSFTANAKDRFVAIKPPQGKWDFRDGTQVRVKIKNTGSAPITPRAKVESNGAYTEPGTVEPLAPGAEAEILVPFAASKPVEIEANTGTKKAPPTVKGTGTTFSSNAVSAVTLGLEKDAAPASFTVESILVESPVAQLPDWLGQRPPVEGDWKKTFDEEFDGTTVDTSKWNNTGPNFWDKQSHWSKDNVIVADGVAKLRYEKKRGHQNDDPAGKETEYQSGYLDTYGKWTQKYGYFEARMKLPKAPGLWPAFWMMPDRGEAAGEQWKRASTDKDGMEFDIMEFLSGWGVHRYNIAMHWDGYGKNHKATGNEHIYVQTDKDGFITCGLLWEPGKVTYYANGQPVLSWSDPRISTVQGDLMFTLPMGGWDNAPLDPKQLPDDFVIDYVRCWQRADMASK